MSGRCSVPSFCYLIGVGIEKEPLPTPIRKKGTEPTPASPSLSFKGVVACRLVPQGTHNTMKREGKRAGSRNPIVGVLLSSVNIITPTMIRIP